jgi:hypothetical protein
MRCYQSVNIYLLHLARFCSSKERMAFILWVEETNRTGNWKKYMESQQRKSYFYSHSYENLSYTYGRSFGIKVIIRLQN